MTLTLSGQIKVNKVEKPVRAAYRQNRIYIKPVRTIIVSDGQTTLPFSTSHTETLKHLNSFPVGSQVKITFELDSKESRKGHLYPTLTILSCTAV